uniref:Dehydrogenase/reductase SDR family member 13-like n=1 Tax=Salarias fasciatus TaxID=181472 RepID=A0A672FWT8_SALFA
MCTLLLYAVVFAGAAYIFRQIFVKGKRCKSQLNLTGKTVIVTGSNTGIGKTTAIDLAKRGARVILACRNEQRGLSALEEVKKATGSSQVVFMQLNLGSMKSVRSFAETFLKNESRLDILINNAGLFMQGRTSDGLGLTFGVNHIGHFLLTHLLLDRLKQCGPSRIVNVSSIGHNFGNIDFDCLTTHKALGLGTSLKEVFQCYTASKLCNVLFTYELAKKLQGTQVTCYSLHPGAIKTEIWRNTSSLMQLAIASLMAFFFKNPVQGSQTTLHCALQQGIEHLSGRYFNNCTVRDVYPKAKDDVAAKRLWELSEKLTGLA